MVRVLVPVEELLFFNPPSLMLKLNLKVLMMVVKVAKRNSVGLKKNFKFQKKNTGHQCCLSMLLDLSK